MTTRPRVALFIDAENASPQHLPDYLEHCRTLGKPTIARCYGSAAALKGWDIAIAKHHLVPVQTPPGAAKANASDFALTIDAVSLLHRGLFDHAVIASSDADFTLLAVHIREQGKGVDGIGEAKATNALKSVFDNFLVIAAPAKPKLMAKQATATHPVHNHRAELRATYTRLAGAARVTLATFGKAFKKDYPSIDLGKGKLKKTLEANGFKISATQEVTLAS